MEATEVHSSACTWPFQVAAETFQWHTQQVVGNDCLTPRPILINSSISYMWIESRHWRIAAIKESSQLFFSLNPPGTNWQGGEREKLYPPGKNVQLGTHHTKGREEGKGNMFGFKLPLLSIIFDIQVNLDMSIRISVFFCCPLTPVFEKHRQMLGTVE